MSKIKEKLYMANFFILLHLAVPGEIGGKKVPTAKFFRKCIVFFFSNWSIEIRNLTMSIKTRKKDLSKFDAVGAYI